MQLYISLMFAYIVYLHINSRSLTAPNLVNSIDLLRIYIQAYGNESVKFPQQLKGASSLLQA